ncbi:MAG: hypothetical protein GY820_41265, partial [Gammaproteobacteria bacterium]|nr:hypothetical protein [Gammaproteobacteria bacterium]
MSQASIAAKLQAKGMGVNYTRMRQNNMTPHSAPFRREMSKTAISDPITGFSTFPLGKIPQNKYVYMVLGESILALVKDNMQETEANYYKHVFGNSTYLEAKEGKRARMQKYFSQDKLGLLDIPITDGICWKVITVTICVQASSSTWMSQQRTS